MDDRLGVLVVDDDRFLCQLLRDYLTLHSYEVLFAHTGPDGVALALSSELDAVILDVMLPGMDGFEVLRRIRGRSDVPVLMLTARGDEPDRISGLNKGADDYLPKTFSHKELLARLNAVIRRSSSARPKESYAAGDLVVDTARRIARLGDSRLDLTPVEFDILLALMRADGRVLSREQLLQEASKRGFDVSERSVDVHISSLRRKLRDGPKGGSTPPGYIETVRNIGYRLSSLGDC
jgi:DNA-binding response OmpR family regulator